MRITSGKHPPALADRPKCPCCGTPLRPWIREERERQATAQGIEFKLVERTWFREAYRSYGAFCTLRCCERFANASYKAGYRMN